MCVVNLTSGRVTLDGSPSLSGRNLLSGGMLEAERAELDAYGVLWLKPDAG